MGNIPNKSKIDLQGLHSKEPLEGQKEGANSEGR